MSDVDCNLSTSSLSYKLDETKLSLFQAIFFISLEPLNIMLNLFLIITFVCWKEFRKQPADLILGISLSQMLTSLTSFASGILALTNHNLRSFDTLCQLIGSFKVLAGVTEAAYNISFCIYLVLRIRFLFKNTYIPNYIFHLCILIANIGLGIWIYLTKEIGKTWNGTCGLLSCELHTIIYQNVKFLVFFIVAFISIWYFKKKIPDDPFTLKIKQNILSFYYLYVKISSFVWTLSFILFILNILNGFYWKSSKLLHLNTFDSILTSLLIMTLSFIRFRDPFLKPKLNRIKTYIYKIFFKNNKDITNSLNESFNSKDEVFWNSTNEVIVEKKVYWMGESEIINKKKSSISKNGKDFELSQMKYREKRSSTVQSISVHEMDKAIHMKLESFNEPDYDPNKWLDHVSQNLQRTFGYSMITGILVSFQTYHKIYYSFEKKKFQSEELFVYSSNNSESETEKEEKSMSCTEYHYQRPNPLIFHERKTFIIKEKIFFEENIGGKPEKEAETKMIVYGGSMYFKILAKERKIDLKESLNLTKNLSNLEKMGVSEGGKSGEFFFSSFDNKLLIKTIKKSDLEMFNSHFKEYYEYLMSENYSFITKIFGLYSFRRTDIDQIEHIILMKNLIQYPYEIAKIEKIYDLKGSTHDRKVLENEEELNENEIKVLKDLDFQKLEQKIFIEENKAKLVQKILEKDSSFFKKCGFIDYSLLVIKIRKNECENSECLESIPSSKEKDIFYHIGIIDFFQKYNLQKMFEKYGKKMMKFHLNLDTSSQDPVFYSERFVNMIKNLF